MATYQEMDLKIDELSSIGKNNPWLLVQYDRGPTKFARKSLRASDLIFNKQHETPTINNGLQHKEERVFIQDGDEIFLGDVIYKTYDEVDALRKHQFVQAICKHVLQATQDLNAILELLSFDENMWFLVAYTNEQTATCANQYIFGIFHKKDVDVKADASNHISAFVHDKKSVYKGIAINASYDVKELQVTMDLMKQMIHKNVDVKQKNLELGREIDRMKKTMNEEYEMLEQAFAKVDKRISRARERLAYLENLAKLNNLKN